MAEKMVREISLDELLDNGNIRSVVDEGGIRELANSMQERGLLNPILVRQGGESADGTRKYRVVSGHRRVAAARLLGWNKIDGIVKSIKAEEYLQIQLIENLQREDMNPLDVSAGVTKLKKEFNFKQVEIATMLGKTEAWVSQVVSIGKLPDTVKERITSGDITFSKAIELAKLKQPEVVEQIAKKAVSQSTEQVAQAVRDAREQSGEPSMPRNSAVPKTKTIRNRGEIEKRLLEYRNRVAELTDDMIGKEENDFAKRALKDEKFILLGKIEELEWIMIIDTTNEPIQEIETDD